jgi:dUTPase
MQILIKKVDNVNIPKRGNPDDAAYDIIATSDPIIIGGKIERYLDGVVNAWEKIDYIAYKTNLFIAPQDQMKTKQIIKFHTLLLPRSSISKKNLVLANSVGLIDNGYRGEIEFRFKYIMQPEDMLSITEYGRTKFYCNVSPNNIYLKGDKIGQIMAQSNIDIDFQVVEQLDPTVRGEHGFGSTN